MLELRASGNDIVAPYAEKFPKATFVPGRRPWEVKVDIALPCATQNELDGEDAQHLIKNQVLCVGEISNMGCTPEAIDAFIEHKMDRTGSGREVAPDYAQHSRTVREVWYGKRRIYQLREGCQHRRIHESGSCHDGSRYSLNIKDN